MERISLVPTPKTTLKDEIDRHGRLSAILADYAVQIAPYAAECDQIEVKILERYGAAALDAVLTDEGNLYRLRVSACAEQQAITSAGKTKVFKILGKPVFISLAKLTFENLKSSLTAEQYQSVVVKARTGNRSVKTVLKAAPEPLRAA